MSVSKIAVIQDSKYRDEKNNNNETSIFLPKSVLDEMNYTYQEETEVSLHIFKSDVIKSLGMIMNLINLPLYFKQEPLDLMTDHYIKALSDINSFFGDSEEKIYTAVYEPNKSQNLRGYFKELNNDGFNIRNYIVQNHTVLTFEKTSTKDILHLNTFLKKTEAEDFVNKQNFTPLIIDLDENSVRNTAKMIIHKLYEYDKFENIKNYFTQKLNPGIEEAGVIPSGSLANVFTGSRSDMYNQTNRTFQDEIFKIQINGVVGDYKLTTQWQGFSTEGESDDHGRQYIWALRDFVNKHYDGIFQIKNIGEKAQLICLYQDYRYNNLENFDNTDSIVSDFIRNDIQQIYYGVPGSGKSFGIDKFLEKEIPNKKDRDVQTKRVVFHPEYSNADFIGQILPKLNDKGVDYKFSAGPFTSILKNSYDNPKTKFYLIIEEINRGNAAAIFGDLFQLLDRDIETGFSSYSVNNDDVNYYIFGEGHLNEGIKLPPNLSILATMNTSDQNVFTLDNAFQRRWDMKLVENTFEKQANDDDESVGKKEKQRNAKLRQNPEITWEVFQKAINIKIGEMATETGLSSMEDKRLGCWFVKAVKEGNDYYIENTEFAEKVLKYLWDDVFKFSREKIFGDYKNLEQLSAAYKDSQTGLKVFKDCDSLFNSNFTEVSKDKERNEN